MKTLIVTLFVLLVVLVGSSSFARSSDVPVKTFDRDELHEVLYRQGAIWSFFCTLPDGSHFAFSGFNDGSLNPVYPDALIGVDIASGVSPIDRSWEVDEARVVPVVASASLDPADVSSVFKAKDVFGKRSELEVRFETPSSSFSASGKLRGVFLSAVPCRLFQRFHFEDFKEGPFEVQFH